MIDDTASVQYSVVRMAVAQLRAIQDDMRKKKAPTGRFRRFPVISLLSTGAPPTQSV
jgi:hypothetical protein